VAKNSAGRATESVRRGSVAHEWLAVWLGQLVVVETSGGVTGASALEMPPTRVRDYLCEVSGGLTVYLSDIVEHLPAQVTGWLQRSRAAVKAAMDADLDSSCNTTLRYFLLKDRYYG
jgi:hypothetical protein